MGISSFIMIFPCPNDKTVEDITNKEAVLMNRRERLRRCYFGEELDRPGVYSRTLFPANDPSYDRLKAYLAEHSELKLEWNTSELDSPWPIEVIKEPYNDELEREITTLHTPKGDLQKSDLVRIKTQAKDQPKLHEVYLLKSKEDAEKYLSLPVPTIKQDVSAFHKLEKTAGDSGIVDVSLWINPAGHAAGLFGSENFALMTIMERDIIHAICRRQMNIIMNRLKFLLSRGVGPFFSMLGEEMVAPPFHGPKDFDDFNLKYDKPIIDMIHDAGGRIHIHCHGSIKKVLDSFIDMGTDVLHPFEAPPMGDITPKQAKETARGKLCLEGNIQIDRMYEATPDEIREETRQLIKETFDDHKGLIVSVTASPYIYGRGEECFGRYKAMIDTVLEWNG